MIEQVCPKCGSGMSEVVEITEYCLGCDGCGWCEGSPAHTCPICSGTGVKKRNATLTHAVDGEWCLGNQLATVTAERDKLQQRVAELEGRSNVVYSHSEPIP